MKKRPSWSNIGAVLFAIWFGMTCTGCVYSPPPPPTNPQLTCIVLVGMVTDSLTVGIHKPPCGVPSDTVFYWRLPLPRDCAWRATIETPRGAAKLQSACSPSLSPLPRG